MISKDYSLIIKLKGLARKIMPDGNVAGKERFLFNSFFELAE